MARILGVGIATLDIVNIVDGFPAEDTEVRAVAQHIRRGGNATNSLVVLSQLGHRCSWAGVLADEPDGQRILDDLKRYAIDTSACRIEHRGKVPTSYIIRDQRTGSRTIVHYRDLPELAYEHFAGIDLSGYDWLHFEGRNVAETRRMLEHARGQAPHTPRSVELEKPRPGIDGLLPHADVLLFSKDFAASRGFDDPGAFLAAMSEHAPTSELVCAWGEAGAYGLEPSGRRVYSPAYPPPAVVDTVGAGDTFNAGVINARIGGYGIEAALAFGCRLAGRKCGQEGLGDLDTG